MTVEDHRPADGRSADDGQAFGEVVVELGPSIDMATPPTRSTIAPQIEHIDIQPGKRQLLPDMFVSS